MSMDKTVAMQPDRRAIIGVGFGASLVLLLLLYLMIGGLTDPRWIVWIDRDFVNYWTASRLILSGEVMDLFSGQDRYFPHLQAAFGVDYPWHNWSYPPNYLLFVLPLGFLSFHVSMTLFLIVTMLVYLHSVCVSARRIETISAVLIVPFIACNIITAQNGFITGALMLYGLALRDRSPVWAGIAIGLLTAKPQLGILFPILLLMERRWTVILSASVTTAVAIGLSILLFGLDAWKGYVEHNIPYQGFVMTDMGGTFLHMMPSLYGGLRSLDFDAASAFAVHLSFAGLALAAFLASLFYLKTAEERGFSLVLATFLVAPYSLVYDLGAPSALAAIWAHRAVAESPLPIPRRIVFTCVAFLPLLHAPLSTYLQFPIAPAVIAAGPAVLILQRRAMSQPNRARASAA